MKRLFSGGGKLFSKAVIYSATLSFVGINFFTFSHYIKHSYWDNLHSCPPPQSGHTMQPPEEITASKKEEKLFYTLKSNSPSSSASTSNTPSSSEQQNDIKNINNNLDDDNSSGSAKVKKLVVYLPDFIETREVFQDLEYQLLHQQQPSSQPSSSSSEQSTDDDEQTIYSLRYDRFGYGFSSIVKSPRHLHNMSIELHTLIEHVIQNEIQLKPNEKLEISLVSHGFGSLLSRMYIYKFSNQFSNNLNENVKISKNILISPLHERFIQFSPFYLDYLVEWKSRGFINRLLAFHGFMEWFFKFNPEYSLKKQVIEPFMESISDETSPNWEISYKGTEGSTNYDDDHMISREEARKRLEYHMRNDNLWKTVRNETNLYKRSCVQLNDCRKLAENQHLEEEETNGQVKLEGNSGSEEQQGKKFVVDTSKIDVLVVDVDHEKDGELGRGGIAVFFDKKKNGDEQQMDYLNDLIEGYSNKSRVIALNQYNHYSVLNSGALAQNVISFLKQ